MGRLQDAPSDLPGGRPVASAAVSGLTPSPAALRASHPAPAERTAAWPPPAPALRRPIALTPFWPAAFTRARVLAKLAGRSGPGYRPPGTKARAAGLTSTWTATPPARCQMQNLLYSHNSMVVKGFMLTTLVDIRKHFKSGDTAIPTLGGRSKLTLRITPTQIFIINNKENGMTLDQDILDKVVARRAKLSSEEKNMSSRYNRPFWPNPPAGQHTPSVPAVLREMGR